MDNREFTIPADGISLHAKLDFPADGAEKLPLVILIHGLTGHMEEGHILAAKEALCGHGYGVLRVELYGHGQSEGDFYEHNLLKWVDELLTVIDYAAALPFVTELYLAGHSQGGLATILAGALRRDVLRAILPLAPAIVIWDGARKGALLGGSFDPERIPNELTFPGGRTINGNYLRVAQLLPVEEAIARFKKPVLLVHADTDESVPVSYAYWAAERYADARLVIIQGDDHCFHGKVHEVTEAILAFLDEVRG